jgi:uncharacterized membrane protein YeaQ/YmgE (transglycosylase-associated protein family)
MGLIGSLDFFAGVDVFVCLAIGAVLGWLAGPFMRGGGYGLIANIVIGMLGGVLGGFIFDWINILDLGDLLDPLIAGALGAVVVLAIASAVRPAAPTRTA